MSNLEIDSKLKTRDINGLQSAGLHELWQGGDATKTFTAATGWPRAIRVDASGTLIMTDQDDTSVTYNVLKGERLDFRPKTINTSSTADVQIWW